MLADHSHSGSFDKIKSLWEELDQPLYPVTLQPADYPELDEQTLRFLSEVGFPEASAPGLDFTDLSERLFTHTQLYHREDYPVLDEYFVIGADSTGNPVCIDTGNGSIVCIDHDHGFEAVFMNSSLIQFGYSMALYAAVSNGQQDPGPEEVEQLRLHMKATDPAAMAEGAFWELEIADLERGALFR
jgi:hypothetical protein